MSKIKCKSEIPFGYSLFKEDLDHIAIQLANELVLLRGANIFITGGTGFFGIWLLEGLLWVNTKYSLDLRITALCRSPEFFLNERGSHLKKNKQLSFISGNIINFKFPDENFSHIVHAASEPNLFKEPGWAQRHLDTAIIGTRRILDMAAIHRPKAVLITTSGAVYSSMDKIDNNLCVECLNGDEDYSSEQIVYGQSKRMMEIMTSVSAKQHGYQALIARCFAFVGPYLSLDRNFAVGNFIRDALVNGEIVVSGDGRPLRSYLYASDLVVWLIRILLRGRSGVPYNVGGDEVVSIYELAEIVAKVTGITGKVIIKGEPVPGASVSAYLPSLRRSSVELDLRPLVSLETAIKRTINWHRQRGDLAA